MAKYSQMSTVAVTAVAGQLVGQQLNRIGLTISCPLTSTVTISTDSAVASGGGINLMPNTLPFEISLEKHGDLVQKRLFVIGAGAVTIGIVETFEL